MGPDDSRSTKWVVEVDVGKVMVSCQGVEWWLIFRRVHDRIGRIRDLGTSCIVDPPAQVTCEDKEHAEWLAEHMVNHGGLPRSAVQIKAARGPSGDAL